MNLLKTEGASLARSRKPKTRGDRTKPTAPRPAHPRRCPSRPPRPGSPAGERPEAGRAEGPGPEFVGCRPRSPLLRCHRRPLASGLCGPRAQSRLSKGALELTLRSGPEPPCAPLVQSARTFALAPPPPRPLRAWDSCVAGPAGVTVNGAQVPGLITMDPVLPALSGCILSVEDKVPRFSLSAPAPLTSSCGCLSLPYLGRHSAPHSATKLLIPTSVVYT